MVINHLLTGMILQVGAHRVYVLPIFLDDFVPGSWCDRRADEQLAPGHFGLVEM